MNGIFRNIKVIAIDADDTLWDCQSHFEKVENRLYELLRPWCDEPAKELFKTESANMEDLGFGCKAFTLSVLETAMRVSRHEMPVSAIEELLILGKGLLHLPATPLPGVEATLKKLRTLIEESTEVGESPVRLVCFTKGELQDQENKLKRSGLLPFFDDVEITSDKTQREFRALCEHQHIHPSELLMIGNSLKSDIAPALAIGAWGIHIPFHVTWQLEQYAVNNGVASLVEDFDHERLIKISQFSEILNYL